MSLTLHVIPFSHPCLTADAALRLKGLDFETVTLTAGRHAEEIEAIYGEGRRTVPGLLVDGEPVHGTIGILERLDALAPVPPLYPSDAVREAERWAEAELQQYGRTLIWGVLHFRPEAIGTFGGAGPLDPAGTDFAIRTLRAAWRYNDITAVRIAETLAAMPAALDRVDALAAEGLAGGDEPTALDLHIGATLRMLLVVGDLRALIEGRPAEAIARRWFPDYPGDIPAGAFPAGWVPAR